MSTARPPDSPPLRRHPRSPLANFIRLSALGFALSGIGLGLVAPIHAAFSLGHVNSPNTPLYTRHNAEHHQRVVTRIATSGLYMILLGAATFAAHELCQQVTRPRNAGPP